ncbi:MAG: hypothetical protein AAF984_00760 [Verrucomicrobiota bacterium]
MKYYIVVVNGHPDRKVEADNIYDALRMAVHGSEWLNKGLDVVCEQKNGVLRAFDNENQTTYLIEPSRTKVKLFQTKRTEKTLLTRVMQ